MLATQSAQVPSGAPGSRRRIVKFGRSEIGVVRTLAATYQHFPIRKQRGRMPPTRGNQVSSRAPGSARRIVYLRGCEIGWWTAKEIRHETAGDEDRSVAQQGRGVSGARGETSGGCPYPGSRVEELCGAVLQTTVVGQAPCRDEDLPVLEQGSGVMAGAISIEIARGGERKRLCQRAGREREPDAEQDQLQLRSIMLTQWIDFFHLSLLPEKAKKEGPTSPPRVKISFQR